MRNLFGMAAAVLERMMLIRMRVLMGVPVDRHQKKLASRHAHGPFPVIFQTSYREGLGDMAYKVSKFDEG